VGKPRRILARLFTAASAGLFLASVFMWIRSFSVRDTILHIEHDGRNYQMWAIYSYEGPVSFDQHWGRLAPDGTYFGFRRSLLRVEEIRKWNFISSPSADVSLAKFDWDALGFAYRPYTPPKPPMPTDRWADPQKDSSWGLKFPHALLAVSFLIAPLWHFGAYCRGRRRTLIGRCVHCGYDLRATPARCPECGNAVGSRP
jgi:hypothetical protein